MVALSRWGNVLSPEAPVIGFVRVNCDPTLDRDQLAAILRLVNLLYIIASFGGGTSVPCPHVIAMLSFLRVPSAFAPGIARGPERAERRDAGHGSHTPMLDRILICFFGPARRPLEKGLALNPLDIVYISGKISDTGIETPTRILRKPRDPARSTGGYHQGMQGDGMAPRARRSPGKFAW